MSKRPSFQFYPPDWRNDAGLRLCSISARGLWIEMMCLMHDATPYGHLTVLGRPMTAEALARLVGEGVAPVKRWLAELRDNEVFSVDADGVIFSRRMVRDEAVREARAAGGPAGAAHGHKGASHGSKGGRPRKGKPPLPDEQRGVSDPPPSSSSPSPSPEYSEANASGGEPPLPEVEDAEIDELDPPEAAKPKAPSAIDLKAAIFSTGVDLLTAANIPDKQARSLLGMWKGEYGDAAVIDALAICQAEASPNPKAFITATLQARHGKRTHGKRNGWLDA